jgi:hypothetical protein
MPLSQSRTVDACMHALLSISVLMVCSLSQIALASSAFEGVEFGTMVGLSEVNLIRDGQFGGEDSYWDGIENMAGEGSIIVRRIGYDGLPAPALEVNVSEGFALLSQYVDVPFRLDSLILTFYAKKLCGTGSINVSALGIEPVLIPDENWKRFSVDFLHTPTLKWPGSLSFSFNNQQSSETTILLDNVTLLAKAKENTCLIEVNFCFADPKGDGVYNVDAEAGVAETGEYEWGFSGLRHDLYMDWEFNRYSVASLYLANGTYSFDFDWFLPFDWDVYFARHVIVDVQPGKPDTYVFEVPLYCLTIDVTVPGDAVVPRYTWRIWRKSGYTTEYFGFYTGKNTFRISPGDYNLTVFWHDSLGYEHLKETWFTIDSDKKIHVQLNAVNVANLIFTPLEIASLGIAIGLSIAFTVSIVYIIWKRRHKITSKSEERESSPFF